MIPIFILVGCLMCCAFCGLYCLTNVDVDAFEKDMEKGGSESRARGGAPQDSQGDR